MWAKVCHAINFAAHSCQQDRFAFDADTFHVAFFEIEYATERAVPDVSFSGLGMGSTG